MNTTACPFCQRNLNPRVILSRVDVEYPGYRGYRAKGFMSARGEATVVVDPCKHIIPIDTTLRWAFVNNDMADMVTKGLKNYDTALELVNMLGWIASEARRR